MMNTATFLSILRRSTVAGAIIAVAVVVGPASANKDPVTPNQLKLYEQAFMEEVRKGDLLFHGDAAMAEQLDVKLSNTGWACAMCHPMASNTHPHAFPKFQASMAKFATLRDMINWCIEKPNQGEKIDPESEAMKALEAYITWSNTGSVLVPGKY
jgi:thiosulfate dehydrogenase